MRSNFLPLTKPHIEDQEIEAVSKVLKSGHLTTGSKVNEFEKNLSGYIGPGISAVALSSCTAGLYLSLLATGIGKGDEVIVPTWTFAATAHVVLWSGAKVVLCDVEKNSLNIDVGILESLITCRTKAIIPVHYAGYPCDMDKILEIARKNKLVVIEDAAHAIGTEYKGKKIGSLYDIAVFSFYATKNLTCGEGGMVVSKNEELIEKIRKISYFGINKQAFNRYEKRGHWYYDIEEVGYKYNMDNIHAALGVEQLKKIDQVNRKRRDIASMYKKDLDKRISFFVDDKINYHTYHLFPIRVPKNIIARDDFINELKQKNIGTSVHFIPLHKHSYYKDVFKGLNFPVADEVYEDIVSIPMFPSMSDEDVFYVIENINGILKRSK